ncbi:MAG: hypothetical protein M1574_06280, partial [Gammaproteobacteria bacterium]|nr:hypothetical protein [Gammaproteobacteria bacterium]
MFGSRHVTSSTPRLALVAAASILFFLGGCSSAKRPETKASVPVAASPSPVYVHMNGHNMFLENVVAVAPGQPVVFVNEDTGMHMVLGYNPLTGKVNPKFSGSLMGTPGPAHPVSTYRVRFTKPGVYYYFCPVHAELKKAPGNVYVPIKRPGVHGFPVHERADCFLEEASGEVVRREGGGILGSTGRESSSHRNMDRSVVR